jgi:hypothetical protein
VILTIPGQVLGRNGINGDDLLWRSATTVFTSDTFDGR